MAVILSVVGKYDGKDLERAQRQLATMQKQTETFGNKMSAFGDKMQSMGRSVGAAGKGLTLGLTMPIVGIGVAALAAGATFEKSMNKVRAVSGVTGEEFEQLKTAAKEMGRTTQFSASEAADGMTFLAMAGFKTNEIVKALPATLNLAAVGEMELAAAADVASNVLGGFNMTADKTNKVVDVMAKVSASANTSVAQMGEALSFAAPIANTAGISIEAASAFIGRLGDAGIQGSRAGTTLVGVIGALENATPKAAKRLKELGIQTHTATGELLPLDNIVEQLGKSTITAGDFLSIFGKRAGPGLAAVVGMGVKGLTDLEQKAIDSGGAAENMANVQLEGLAGQMVKLKSAFEGLLIGIADSGLMTIVTDFFVKLTERVSALVQTIEKMSPESKKMILMFVGIAAAIGPVLMIVGKVMVMVGGLLKVFAAITVVGSILAIKIIAVVAVLAAIGLAFKWAYDNSEPLRKAVDNLVTTFKNVFNIVKNSVLGAFSSMNGEVGKANTVFTLIGNYIKFAFTATINNITTVIKILGAAFQVAMKVFEVGFTILRMGAGIIRGVLLAAFDILMNKLGPISTALRNVGNGVRSVFSGIAGFISSAFNNVGKAIEKFINFAIGGINVLIRAYNAIPIVSDIAEIAEFSFSKMSGATDAAASSANNLANQIGGYAGQVMRGNKAVDATFNTNTQAAVSFDALGGAATTAGNATEKSGGKAKEAANKYKENFDAVNKHLTGIVEDIKKKMEDMATSVSASLMRGFQFGEALKDTDEEGKKLGTTFVERLNEQAKKVTGFAQLIKDLMAEGLSINSPLMQAVIAEGVGSGTEIAKELINSGAEGIAQSEAILLAAQGAADEIGTLAASNFYQAGLDSAQETLKAFVDRFGVNGAARKRLMTLMDNLANAMKRETTITVTTINKVLTEKVGTSGKVVVGATGGIVNRPTFALIGESGPEAVIPLNRTRGNSPLPMTGGGRAGGGSIINLTVNAGMGTDGTQVGEQIVSALRQYQRRNGALPLTVA